MLGIVLRQFKTGGMVLHNLLLVAGCVESGATVDEAGALPATHSQIGITY